MSKDKNETNHAREKRKISMRKPSTFYKVHFRRKFRNTYLSQSNCSHEMNPVPAITIQNRSVIIFKTFAKKQTNFA